MTHTYYAVRDKDYLVYLCSWNDFSALKPPFLFPSLKQAKQRVTCMKKENILCEIVEIEIGFP